MFTRKWKDVKEEKPQKKSFLRRNEKLTIILLSTLFIICYHLPWGIPCHRNSFWFFWFFSDISVTKNKMRNYATDEIMKTIYVGSD